MNKSINEYSHKELMALPHRKWDKESIYDSVIVISTRRKHDSGWAVMSIIGIVGGKPQEQAVARCDHIEWKLPSMVTFGDDQFTMGQMNTDCALRSGGVHFWARKMRFKVGIALSSTTIEGQ